MKSSERMRNVLLNLWTHVKINSYTYKWKCYSYKRAEESSHGKRSRNHCSAISKAAASVEKEPALQGVRDMYTRGSYSYFKTTIFKPFLHKRDSTWMNGSSNTLRAKTLQKPSNRSLLHLVTLEAGIILRAPTPRWMLASTLLLPALPIANLSNRYLRPQPRATRLQRPAHPPAVPMRPQGGTGPVTAALARGRRGKRGRPPLSPQPRSPLQALIRK